LEAVEKLIDENLIPEPILDLLTRAATWQSRSVTEISEAKLSFRCQSIKIFISERWVNPISFRWDGVRSVVSEKKPEWSLWCEWHVNSSKVCWCGETSKRLVAARPVQRIVWVIGSTNNGEFEFLMQASISWMSQKDFRQNSILWVICSISCWRQKLTWAFFYKIFHFILNF
jgi:hypothetical protein